jgi:hypothetical protein
VFLLFYFVEDIIAEAVVGSIVTIVQINVHQF